MLAITVSPAIMGFELPEQGSGALRRVWCVRTGEAPGQRSGLWCEVWVRARTDRSSLWQDSAHRGSVSHPDQWVSSQAPSLHFFDTDMWNIYFGIKQCNANMAKKTEKIKNKTKRVVPTRFLLSQCFHFACMSSLLLQDADTTTHKGTHLGARQSHSSCGITETQTGACAHTLCSTFQGGRCSVAHMLQWPLCLWVRALWWVTTFLASRPVCFPKTVSSIL